MTKINYAAICHKGYVRSKNQDNLWCNGTFLQSENEGLHGIISGEIEASLSPAFAVFDGMGGEQRGEMAAYIAATCFSTLYYSSEKKDAESFLLKACLNMNRSICEYQSVNHIHQMGTTAVILMVGQNDVFLCNIGDSRLYRYSDNKLEQLSCDHVETNAFGRKASLTQNLGIPETEFVIEPQIAKSQYENGYIYLLCSDGLTDMVSDETIESIIAAEPDISNAANVLVHKALDGGGIDNITAILCKICEH